MNNFGWENPTPVRSEISVPPSISWSNHYDNFTGSSEGYSTFNEKSQPHESLLGSSLELHRILARQTSSDLDRISESVEISRPASDSINNSLDLDWLQYQEAIMSAVDSVLTRPVLGSSTLGEAAASSRFAHPLTENFGTTEELRGVGNIDGVQHGISATFSRCKNVYSKSENHGSCGRHQPNLDDVGSQGSSKSDTRRVESSKAKTNAKRKFEEFEIVRESNYDCSLLRSNSSTEEGGFQIHFAREHKSKEPRPEKGSGWSSIIDFVREGNYEPDTEAMAELKEMVYKSAAQRPVRLSVEDATKKPKRKNVRISSDPQTVAARQRRERISERLRTLQTLVPGGSKLDIASVLDEAANYLKFLKSQVKVLENGSNPANTSTAVSPFPVPLNQAFPMQKNLFRPPKTLNASKKVRQN
ncbi:unnamed protein product [Musa hybrid cultivar]